MPRFSRSPPDEHTELHARENLPRCNGLLLRKSPLPKRFEMVWSDRRALGRRQAAGDRGALLREYISDRVTEELTACSFIQSKSAGLFPDEVYRQLTGDDIFEGLLQVLIRQVGPRSQERLKGDQRTLQVAKGRTLCRQPRFLLNKGLLGRRQRLNVQICAASIRL